MSAPVTCDAEPAIATIVSNRSRRTRHLPRTSSALQRRLRPCSPGRFNANIREHSRARVDSNVPFAVDLLVAVVRQQTRSRSPTSSDAPRRLRRPVQRLALVSHLLQYSSAVIVLGARWPSNGESYAPCVEYCRLMTRTCPDRRGGPIVQSREAVDVEVRVAPYSRTDASRRASASPAPSTESSSLTLSTCSPPSLPRACSSAAGSTYVTRVPVRRARPGTFTRRSGSRGKGVVMATTPDPTAAQCAPSSARAWRHRSP